jgi:hypothetical protein
VAGRDLGMTSFICSLELLYSSPAIFNSWKYYGQMERDQTFDVYLLLKTVNSKMSTVLLTQKCLVI